jgi:hypothetical protein
VLGMLFAANAVGCLLLPLLLNPLVPANPKAWSLAVAVGFLVMALGHVPLMLPRINLPACLVGNFFRAGGENCIPNSYLHTWFSWGCSSAQSNFPVPNRSWPTLIRLQLAIHSLSTRLGCVSLCFCQYAVMRASNYQIESATRSPQCMLPSKAIACGVASVMSHRHHACRGWGRSLLVCTC